MTQAASAVDFSITESVAEWPRCIVDEGSNKRLPMTSFSSSMNLWAKARPMPALPQAMRMVSPVRYMAILRFVG